MSTGPSNVFSNNPFVTPEESAEAKGPHATTSSAALERFISSKDLSVVFQPIVRVNSGEVFAYEALVRCALPEYKNPLKLFERALREHCVGRLGKTIREVAVPLCEGVPTFFNVHPVELSDPWLVRPDDPIYTHDQPVFLEITESVPLQHFDLCRSVLREIRQRWARASPTSSTSPISSPRW